MIEGFRMDDKITGRVEAQERVADTSDKELMLEQLMYNTDDHKIKVYKVTNNCGTNHLTTFSYDRAWNMYVERLDARDYPEIELIEVEE